MPHSNGFQEPAPVKISAKFLFAPPPDTVTIPPGVIITKCAARIAYGARKPRSYCPGGATVTGDAINRGHHFNVRNLAAKGW
jgi:hypothetical protein